MKSQKMIWHALTLGVGLFGLVVLNSTLALGDGRFTKQDARKITKACQEAAQFVSDNTLLILFRPVSGLGKFWCAVTNREGDLLSILSSDTQGTPENPKGSDAARLSIRIAIAKAWTSSFSNNEVAVDSKAVGLNSRIDQFGAIGQPGTNAGPGALWGVWATNLFRSFPTETGIKIGERHYGVVPFEGGVPVYDCASGKLVGGAGASGDSVEADGAVITRAVVEAGFCIAP